MNADTAGEWSAYAPHRSHVMLTIDAARRALPDSRHRPSLCILGSGNLNDVDLNVLARDFGEIHLVDIDRGAVAAAIERQRLRSPGIYNMVTIHAPVDISGISEFIYLRRSLPHSLPLIATKLAERPSSFRLTERDAADTFDVVVSSCLLSQLMRQFNEAFPAEEPVRRDLAKAVRDAHVRMLLSLLRGGGVAVLVTEFSSSSIAPTQSLEINDSDVLNAEAERLVSTGNYFTWLAPHEIMDHVLGPQHAGQVWRARKSSPWLWTFLNKRYLCYALSVQRPTIELKQQSVEEERCAAGV